MMKGKVKHLALVLALVSGLAWIFTAHEGVAQAQQSPAPPPAIVGAWVTTVGGTPVGTASFSLDGDVMVTNPADIVGTGHGKWTRKSDQEFSYTLVIPPTGAVGDVRRIRGNITTTSMGDRWSSDKPIIEVYDNGGWAGGRVGPPQQAVRVQ